MTVQEIAALFEDLELRLIESLKRNLARHKDWEKDEGFSWSAWQAEKLRHLWRFRRENAAILGEYAEKIDAETRALLKEQFAESADPKMPDRAFFGVNGKKLDSLVDEMTHNEQRVEKASLRYMDDIYRKTILRAATAFNAGGVTMQQATDMATKDFLERGISCIQYRNGRVVNIATYAEMALRTCNTRAMLLGEAQRREELGIDTVLVSQYGGCSETCLPWQGLVYIDDVWQPYHGESNLAIGGSYGRSRNGRSYLMLSVAVKAGLFHPNCRHHLTTWIEGVSQKPEMMDKAAVERTAKLEKKQRTLERRVRKYKRLAAGTLDPEKAKEYRAKVKDAQKDVREFVAQHGDVLRRDYWRERDDGIAKSSAQQTVKEPISSPASIPQKQTLKFTAPAHPQPMLDVTKEYFETATPNSHAVKDLQSFTVDGVTYTVSGGAVVLDYSTHEKEIAELLERKLGGEIYMVPRINHPDNISTPDYLFRGKRLDLKSIEGNGKNTLYGAVSKKKAQSENFVFDLSKCALSDEEVDRQLATIFWSDHTKFVDSIIVIRNGEIIKILKRNK